MKKIIIASLLLIPLFVSAQKTDTAKIDTIVRTEMTLNEYRALLYAIDVNIDSKKVSKELLQFIAGKTQMVQPADKPKPSPNAPKP